MFRCFTRRVTQSRFPNTTVLAPYLSIRIFDYILALQCTATHLYTKSSLRSSLSVRHRIIHLDKQSLTPMLQVAIADSTTLLSCFSESSLFVVNFVVNFCTEFHLLFVVFNLSYFVKGSFPIR